MYVDNLTERQDLIDRLNIDSEILSKQCSVTDNDEIVHTMKTLNDQWINLTSCASDKYDDLQVHQCSEWS